MDDSPVVKILQAIDNRDVDATMALVSPDVRMLAVDGRRAEGADATRALLTDFLSGLRSMTHRITAQWHPDDVWIAEVEATYELPDRSTLCDLPRVFVVEGGPSGVAANSRNAAIGDGGFCQTRRFKRARRWWRQFNNRAGSPKRTHDDKIEVVP